MRAWSSSQHMAELIVGTAAVESVKDFQAGIILTQKTLEKTVGKINDMMGTICAAAGIGYCWETRGGKVGDVIEAMLGYCWETRRRFSSTEEGSAALARPWPRSGVCLLQSENFWNRIVYNIFRQRFFETLGC